MGFFLVDAETLEVTDEPDYKLGTLNSGLVLHCVEQRAKL